MIKIRENFKYFNESYLGTCFGYMGSKINIGGWSYAKDVL